MKDNKTTEQNKNMSETEIKVGMKVECGDGEDHDTGIVDSVDSVDGAVAVIRWDSGVVTPAPIEMLRQLPSK